MVGEEIKDLDRDQITISYRNVQEFFKLLRWEWKKLEQVLNKIKMQQGFEIVTKKLTIKKCNQVLNRLS